MRNLLLAAALLVAVLGSAWGVADSGSASAEASAVAAVELTDVELAAAYANSSFCEHGNFYYNSGQNLAIYYYGYTGVHYGHFDHMHAFMHYVRNPSGSLVYAGVVYFNTSHNCIY